MDIAVDETRKTRYFTTPDRDAYIGNGLWLTHCFARLVHDVEFRAQPVSLVVDLNLCCSELNFHECSTTLLDAQNCTYFVLRWKHHSEICVPLYI